MRELVAEVADEARLVEIPGNRPSWTATGLQAEEGDTVTWLAWGFTSILRPVGIGAPPHISLRGRVSGGAAQPSPRDTSTFVADRSGPLELASVLPGELHEDGTIAVDRTPFRIVAGGFTAVVARWHPGVDPRTALETIAARDRSGLCAAEAARLADPPAPPPGWEHHPLAPPEEIYSQTEAGIAVHTRANMAIVRRPAEIELTPALRLRWSWRLDELPSSLPEDTLLTHDYLSVALEFDDGQDLTWHWSCALPAGLAYPCPLDHWRHRETHIVVRNGTADLGRWVEEERPVLADHRVAIGGPTPARVVSAWLISVSFFQRSEGRGEFRRIELVDGDRVVRVL